MSVPLVHSPDVAYATKDNIKAPMTQTQATAAEARATARLAEAFPSLTVSAKAGSIKPAN